MAWGTQLNHILSQSYAYYIDVSSGKMSLSAFYLATMIAECLAFVHTV